MKESISFLIYLADAFLKSAISLIPEIQKQIEAQQTALLNKSTLNYDGSNLAKLSSSMTTVAGIEKFLCDFVSNLMTTLLIIPDNPDQGVLYLLTGVINLVQKHFQWENLEIKFCLLANMLVIFNSLKQENYLYHVENVESNDTLYGSDPKFIKELNKLVDSVLDEILKLLESFVS